VDHVSILDDDDDDDNNNNNNNDDLGVDKEGYEHPKANFSKSSLP
jgi:hypothetical protein